MAGREGNALKRIINFVLADVSREEYFSRPE